MRLYFIIFLLTAISLNSNAQVTQWRGTNRDGIYQETGLLKQWPENGPKQILEVEDIGKGWSTPIFADGMIFVTGMIDTLDYLSAIDMQGNIKWQVSYGRSWTGSYPDTRSTPTIEGNRIYVQSGTGRLACIDRETGKENWAIEVDKVYEGEYHVWGNAETPLIVDDKVICTPGGSKTSVVALNKLTGELIWKTESAGGPRSYVSPTIYNYNGQRFILAATAQYLLAVEPESGKIAWKYKFFNSDLWTYQDNGFIWANTPLYKENEIYLSIGYDYPAAMIVMDQAGTSATKKFESSLDNQIGGLVLYDNHVYGSNTINNSRGHWVCMDWETGELTYDVEWDTKGPIVMADGLLYCYNERGKVALVEPNPNDFKIISQFEITKGAGSHWAHPFIADGKLFMRHGEVLFVYDIKEK